MLSFSVQFTQIFPFHFLTTPELNGNTGTSLARSFSLSRMQSSCTASLSLALILMIFLHVYFWFSWLRLLRATETQPSLSFSPSGMYAAGRSPLSKNCYRNPSSGKLDGFWITAQFLTWTQAGRPSDGLYTLKWMRTFFSPMTESLQLPLCSCFLSLKVAESCCL